MLLRNPLEICCCGIRLLRDMLLWNPFAERAVDPEFALLGEMLLRNSLTGRDVVAEFAYWKDVVAEFAYCERCCCGIRLRDVGNPLAEIDVVAEFPYWERCCCGIRLRDVAESVC